MHSLHSNHPLSHLMQSVFGFHNREAFRIFLYATSPWDGTNYRTRIAQDVDHFVDASSWSPQAIIEDIKSHQVHIRSFIYLLFCAVVCLRLS